MIHDLVVRGDVRDVAVDDGLIAAIGPGLPAGREEIDARGLLVLPAGVDPHVHLNDPGRDHWEGVPSGTRALAAGGVASAADMPLNSLPPTIDAAGFDAKAAAVRGRAHVDLALWGGLVPGDPGRLDALAERGVVGFKAFMCPSGVDEFPAVDPDTLGRGMERAAGLGLPVAVHAEDPGLLRPPSQLSSHDDVNWRRPPQAEASAVARVLALAAQTGCAVHLVHLSTAAAVALVGAARAAGVDATCEATPHHLLLDAEDARAIGAMAVCAPPLRSSAERAALWHALTAGAIDMIGSDHSPASPELKRGDDMGAVWGGISGAQTALPLIVGAAYAEGLDAPRIAGLTSAAAAERLGLRGAGRLAVGEPGTMVLVRPVDPWVLRASDLEYRHRHSAFVGRRIGARVVRTLLRGRTIALGGRPVGPPTGRLVTR